jgi:hypothetical protein
MKKIKKELNFRFVISEPPFDFDPNDKGALEKLEAANKSMRGISIGAIRNRQHEAVKVKGR